MMVSLQVFALAASLLAQAGSKTAPDAPEQSPATATANDALAQRLAQVDEKISRVIDLRADFEQRKKTTLLKKPLISTGTLRTKGERVLWDTKTPRKSAMLVTEQEVRIYYPDDRLVEVYPMDKRFREAAGGPLPRLSKMNERFDITEMEPKELGEVSAEGRLLGLRLVPRQDDLKRHLASIRVIIDEQIPCANRVIITDPDGEETEIRFSNVKINTGMEASEVELRLPEGVKVSMPVGPNETKISPGDKDTAKPTGGSDANKPPANPRPK